MSLRVGMQQSRGRRISSPHISLDAPGPCRIPAPSQRPGCSARPIPGKFGEGNTVSPRTQRLEHLSLPQHPRVLSSTELPGQAESC